MTPRVTLSMIEYFSITSTRTKGGIYWSLSVLFFVLVSVNFVSRAHSAEPLRITYNSEWAPYSFGSKALVSGILPDLLSAIVAGDPGLKTMNHGQAWATVERTIRRSQHDAFVTTPTDKRLSFTAASQDVVYVVQMVPVVRMGGRTEAKLSTDLSQGLKTVKICGIKGNGWGENFYGKQGLRYQKVKNVNRCLARLANGSSDVTIQSRAVALKLLNDAGLTDKLTVLNNAAATVGFKLLIRKTFPDIQAWLKKFDSRLAAMKASGEYNRAVEEITQRHTSGVSK